MSSSDNLESIYLTKLLDHLEESIQNKDSPEFKLNSIILPLIVDGPENVEISDNEYDDVIEKLYNKIALYLYGIGKHNEGCESELISDYNYQNNECDQSEKTTTTTTTTTTTPLLPYVITLDKHTMVGLCHDVLREYFFMKSQLDIIINVVNTVSFPQLSPTFQKDPEYLVYFPYTLQVLKDTSHISHNRYPLLKIYPKVGLNFVFYDKIKEQSKITIKHIKEEAIKNIKNHLNGIDWVSLTKDQINYSYCASFPLNNIYKWSDFAIKNKIYNNNFLMEAKILRLTNVDDTPTMKRKYEYDDSDCDILHNCNQDDVMEDSCTNLTDFMIFDDNDYDKCIKKNEFKIVRKKKRTGDLI